MISASMAMPGLPPISLGPLLDSSNTIICTGYSDYEAVRTNQAGSEASLAFTGSWANLGMRQYSSGGFSRNLYRRAPASYAEPQRQRMLSLRPSSRSPPATHTISVTVVGDGQVTLDYLDVYDDTPVSDGEVDVWLGDA